MHPILGKAPQLSWEAKKAGLRSPTLPHKQCKDTLCRCQRCVFSSPHCSLPGRSQHKWNALQAASVALSLFLLLGQSGVLAACGTRRAGGTFTARSRADLLLCPPSPAQPQGSAPVRRDVSLFLLELSWCLSSLRVFIVSSVASAYCGCFCLIRERNCKLLMWKCELIKPSDERV